MRKAWFYGKIKTYMGIPLRVLLVEDSLADAELVLIELRAGGFEPIYERVDTPEAMKAALEKSFEQGWDIILSDYVMPRFSGPAALKLVQEKGVDLPFIMVTGQVGEETAIDAVKAGANDYVLKGNLVRLVPAIQRELREAQVRRERREAQEALQRTYGELETRVKERTAELAKANRELQAEIVERKQAEQERESLIAELVESRARVEAVFASVPEGIVVTDKVGVFQEITRVKGIA